jgi:carboxyl-terminal processing protease
MESTSGEFSGIGVSIMGKNPDDDILPIIEVIVGGPAQKAGIKSGDKVIEVNGEKLRGLTTDEVINKLKGKVGSEVALKIVRDKKPIDFKVKRDIIKDQTSQCYLFKAQNIYYLSLKVFAETSAKQMSELLQKANAKACKGIILDLRHNPGGTLNAAIDMASLFLEKGSLVVVTKNKKLEVVEKYSTKTEPLLNSDIPIFVLIDNLTASASEILAGALRYHSEKSYETSKKKGRKFLVFLLGIQSFGKGSVQEVIPISNGCALKLTTMMYELPGDNSIQAKGITPDFVFKPRFVPVDEMKWIEDLYGKETSLKHHISAEEAQGKPALDKEKVKAEKLKEQKEKEKKEEEYTPEEWEKKRQEALAHDAQIAAAVNMISWLDFARKLQPTLVDSRQKALSFIKERYLTDDTVVLEKVESK